MREVASLGKLQWSVSHGPLGVNASKLAYVEENCAQILAALNTDL